jgi:hypothetical protein
MPLSTIRKKETFWETVRKCLTQDVLMKEQVRKFLQRAREYVCAYHTLHQGISLADQVDATCKEAKVAMPAKIENLVKSFKIHWYAL